ncbi:MAG: alpha-amylase [Spirochaetales bacterium]|nr:alpha-amylase [Spirochaetales bacterium]
MEFHVSRKARKAFGIDATLMASTGNVILTNFGATRVLAQRLDEKRGAAVRPELAITAGRLNAMALIDEILHRVCSLYRETTRADAFSGALSVLERRLGAKELDRTLLAFVSEFPPQAVHSGTLSPSAWLALESGGLSHRELALEEMLMLSLANENPAMEGFRFLFDDTALKAGSAYETVLDLLRGHFDALPPFGPDNQNLLDMLRAPMRAEPYSLSGQLEWIRARWGLFLGSYLLRLLGGLDLIREEEKPRFPGPGPSRAYAYDGLEHEYERFSPDKDWMPKVVMLAKSTLVWLAQLSKWYGREIRTLDAIPDGELDRLASSGFNALWLIGLWERSQASAEIKRRCGNPEAAPSAYSLYDNEIAGELGGNAALENLRSRCAWRGIRLAADMVPNHTGIDSKWMRERPDLFMQHRHCPFPSYRFDSGDLSGDPAIEIKLEDHYYDRTDAAVVFRRVDRRSGETRYIYHGNDGTSMPWNDTAQIDFLNPEAREAVIGEILKVARQFPVIRFDAAMVLARKHVRRLWYPAPGQGGDIASRSESALSDEDFARAMPEEFWREVVDRCAREAPDTLLLAEAFWMLEGYFVRTLGMHRVYNSAFMNMLKKEENASYRATIRNTLEFDRDILKRFVNFMNNPDEETAVAQFGKGDKYFGVATLMATMPGLPMFGHGQVEGFEEKYGMEYRRPYRDEAPDAELVARHEREIFPLLKKRYLFADVERFLLYDFVAQDGSVNENVFAYSNGTAGERALVLYNNAYARADGAIRVSCPFAVKDSGGKRLETRDLAWALGLSAGEDRYLLFREERTSLWYIRRSDEIARSGLRVHLEGFGCQVFLDSHEISDDAYGHYRVLHDRLGGAGTPDVAAAIQDIFLADLYAAFAETAGPALVRRLCARLDGADSATGEALEPTAKGVSKKVPDEAKSDRAFLAGMEGSARRFFEIARALLRGSSGWAAFPESFPAEDDEEAAALAAREWLETLDAALRLGREARDPVLSRALSTLYGPGDEERRRTALAFCLLDGVRAALGPDADRDSGRRLVEHWGLDRKVREAMQAAGVSGDSAWRSVATAKALIPALDEPAAATAPRPKTARAASASTSVAGRARELFARAAVSEELRRAALVNVFEGVVWFNKERFEEICGTAAFAAAVDALRGIGPKAAPPRDPLERVGAVLDFSLAAAAASGYRLDALEAFLETAARAAEPAPAVPTAAPAKPRGAARAGKKPVTKSDTPEQA